MFRAYIALRPPPPPPPPPPPYNVGTTAYDIQEYYTTFTNERYCNNILKLLLMVFYLYILRFCLNDTFTVIVDCPINYSMIVVNKT